jgi:succinate dehydrogenase/fumarate reductase flavoprotein subunit
VTLWPKALRHGVELRSGCRVREIAVDEHGRAHAAVYHDRDGALHKQRASLLVLAANGIGSLP